MRLWDLAGFGILCAWFALLNGWRMLLLLLFAALIHELGHLAVLRVLGVRPEGFQITALGAEIRIPREQISYPAELTVLLAGPGANLLCTTALSAAGFPTAAGAQAVLGLFNLLPVRGLDGGEALRTTFSWIFGPEWGERVSGGISRICAVFLAGLLALLMLCSGGNLWLIPALCGFLSAAAGMSGNARKT